MSDEEIDAPSFTFREKLERTEKIIENATEERKLDDTNEAQLMSDKKSMQVLMNSMHKRASTPMSKRLQPNGHSRLEL